MCGREGSRELRRIGADFVLALVLLCAVVLGIDAGHSRAHAVPLPAIDSQAILVGSSLAGLQTVAATHSISPRTRPVRPDDTQARLLLSLAFAVIMAFNLAFWRHLRRVYASPRRNVWRRG